MSILSHIHEEPPSVLDSVHLLYSSRVLPGGERSILFLPRLKSMFSSSIATSWRLQLYLTNGKNSSTSNAPTKVASFPELPQQENSNQEVHHRRMKHADVLNALGSAEEKSTAMAYVCGPRGMTDETMDLLRGAEGMAEERLRCEKWW